MGCECGEPGAAPPLPPTRSAPPSWTDTRWDNLVLRILDPGSGMGKKSRYGSGIRDDYPGSYFQELRNNLKFFDADPVPGSRIFLTPGFGIGDG
jgi:hypothetical protein